MVCWPRLATGAVTAGRCGLALLAAASLSCASGKIRGTDAGTDGANDQPVDPVVDDVGADPPQSDGGGNEDAIPEDAPLPNVTHEPAVDGSADAPAMEGTEAGVDLDGEAPDEPIAEPAPDPPAEAPAEPSSDLAAPEPPSDLPPDPSPDGSPDVPPDVAPELTPDMPSDPSPDIPVDLAPDLPPDAAPDTPPALAHLVINEANTLSGWVEIWNGTAAAVALDGWAVGVSFSDDFCGGSVYREYAVPAGTSVPAGGFLEIHGGSGTDTPAKKYAGFDICWAVYEVGEVVLVGGAGLGVDYLAFRYSGAGPNKPADLAWSGSLTADGDSIYRKVRLDRDLAADFAVSGDTAGTPGAPNPGQ